jgi:ankyrin repeat protein
VKRYSVSLALGCVIASVPALGMQTKITAAIMKNDEEMVKFLLEDGFDVNQLIDGYPPLQTAAMYGCDTIASLLLKRGAHVDGADKNGDTPLYWAVLREHEKVVSLLLRAGANVNKPDSTFGAHLLHNAALSGNEEIVQLLLSAGANVDAKDFYKSMPLHYALSQNNKKIIEMLVYAGADPETTDQDYSSPYTLVQRHQNTEVLALFDLIKSFKEVMHELIPSMIAMITAFK